MTHKSGGEERVAPLPVNAPCSGPHRQEPADPVDLRVAMILYAGVIRAYQPRFLPGQVRPGDLEEDADDG